MVSICLSNNHASGETTHPPRSPPLEDLIEILREIEQNILPISLASVRLFSSECHRILLMMSQYWFRSGNGFLPSDNNYMIQCSPRSIALLGHHELMLFSWELFIFLRNAGIFCQQLPSGWNGCYSRTGFRKLKIIFEEISYIVTAQKTGLASAVDVYNVHSCIYVSSITSLLILCFAKWMWFTNDYIPSSL